MAHARWFVTVLLVLVGGAAALPAAAFPWDECESSADCPQQRPSCQVRWLVVKRCVNACNSDANCGPGMVCLGGACQIANRPPAPSNPGPGPGRPAGSASRCNPADGSLPHGAPVRDANGKPVGACPTGQVCSNTGFCVTPDR